MDEQALRIPSVTKLQHRSGQSLLLGCDRCPDRPLCGGLQIEAPALSCLDNCTCADPAACDLVCPRNPKAFAKRLREVNGFHLSDIEKRTRLAFPPAPDTVHLVYRSLPLEQPVGLDVVAIPFSEIYRRRGRRAEPRTRRELETKFGLGPNTRIILSGVELDSRVEQWWGSTGRREIAQGLPDLGVILATTPNFSLMTDVPRHDNLHAMKRIALVWSQLHDAKVPTALHLNGRTQHDFMRYREFLQHHDEIDAVAFEFTTGTATNERGPFYIEMLSRLAGDLHRPLHLILRGGPRWANALSKHYGRISVIDTTAFVRTVKRKFAVLRGEQRLSWEHYPTVEGERLDALLSHNLAVVSQWLSQVRSAPSPVRRTPSRTTFAHELQCDLDPHNETLQLRLL